MTTPKTGIAELRKARGAGMGLLPAAFVFSIFINLLMLTGPLFMLQVYDRVLGSRSEETLVSLTLLVIALYGMMGILEYARTMVFARFGARFQTALDERVFDAVVRRSLIPRHRAAPSTGLRDLEAIQGVFTSSAMSSLMDVPWTPIFFAAIFILHPLLGWMSLIGGALVIALTLLNSFMVRKPLGEAQGQSNLANSFSEQTRAASEIVIAQAMINPMRRRWQALRDAAQASAMAAADRSGVFTNAIKSLRLLLQSLSLGLGAWLVLRGEMTPGGIIAGSILLGRALAPIEQSIGQWPQVQRARSAWKDLSELLESTPPEETRVPLPPPSATFQVNNLTVQLPGLRAPILARVRFQALPGQAIGVIGKSGSGKSTLAKALVGLVNPTAGEIRLGGATLDQYGHEALGRYIGYLPQTVTLFTGTVAENIARMHPEPDHAKVVKAAQRANAHEMILGLPGGYDTPLHGNDSILSGGQRQRIALARALYDDPVLLVLDEPNSALDFDGSVALNRAVREFKATNRAVIIMTHRPMAVEECDRLVILESGMVQTEGPRDEVMKALARNAEERKVAPPGAATMTPPAAARPAAPPAAPPAAAPAAPRPALPPGPVAPTGGTT